MLRRNVHDRRMGRITPHASLLVSSTPGSAWRGIRRWNDKHKHGGRDPWRGGLVAPCPGRWPCTPSRHRRDRWSL